MLKAVYHQFEAENSGMDYGDEFDFLAIWKIDKHFKLLVKYAIIVKRVYSQIQISISWRSILIIDNRLQIIMGSANMFFVRYARRTAPGASIRAFFGIQLLAHEANRVEMSRMTS